MLYFPHRDPSLHSAVGELRAFAAKALERAPQMARDIRSGATHGKCFDFSRELQRLLAEDGVHAVLTSSNETNSRGFYAHFYLTLQWRGKELLLCATGSQCLPDLIAEPFGGLYVGTREALRGWVDEPATAWRLPSRTITPEVYESRDAFFGYYYGSRGQYHDVVERVPGYKVYDSYTTPSVHFRLEQELRRRDPYAAAPAR